MRPPHPTHSDVSIHRFARDIPARALPRQPFRHPVRAAQLLDPLLRMAGTTRALLAVARRYFPFRHETARRAVTPPPS